MDGAFHASPARCPCCRGGSVSIHPYCREGLIHRPLEVKRSSLLTTCILLSMGNNPGAQIGNWPYTDLFFSLAEKRGEERFWIIQMVFFVLFCSGHLTENINYFHSHRHSAKLLLFMTSTPVELYRFIITEDSALAFWFL